MRKDSLATLQNILKKTKSNIETLDSRISSLNSPFGPIPLSITELIVLFPILVVVLLVLTVSALAKSSRLYAELEHHLGAGASANGAEELQLYADCWFLPPYRNFIQPLLLILFTLTITGIYIYASLLIYSDPGLFAVPGGDIETIRRTFFMAAYISGVPVLIACIWIGYNRIIRHSEVH